MVSWGVYITDKGGVILRSTSYCPIRRHSRVFWIFCFFLRSCTSKYCEIPNDEILMTKTKCFFSQFNSLSFGILNFTMEDTVYILGFWGHGSVLFSLAPRLGKDLTLVLCSSTQWQV